MTKSLPKLVLSASRDIPFSQLALSQKNVRRVKSGLSIEDLAEDIYRRTLLQSLNVRPMLDEHGNPTGMFEVPAGGRRYRALELLVKTKRMHRDQPVPCVVRESGTAEEDSLAENVMRVGLHPLDQFRAFRTLIDGGLSEDDIAARFFVSVSTVRQRLRLASVSPSLLDIYGEDGMTLEQLMAFSVTDNHVRQQQVWDQINQASHAPAYHIRRLLTEDAISSSDRRVRFIGLETYIAAGGNVMRDLFSSNEEGWLQDPALVEQLVTEKLERQANALRAEGWKWVEAAIDLPYGCENGKRRISGQTVALTADEQATLQALGARHDALGEEYGDVIELPEEIEAALASIEAEIAALTCRPVVYQPADMARAGVFVSLAHNGKLRIDRGYVLPADEDRGSEHDVQSSDNPAAPGPCETSGHGSEADKGTARALPERLVSELTAARTVAIRDTLAQAPHTAFLALLHALCLSAFRFNTRTGCVEIAVTQVWLGTVAPSLRETVWSIRIQQRHDRWSERLPDDTSCLWDWLAALGPDEQMELLAHCVSLGVNALFEPVKGHDGRVSAHGIAQRLAAADALAACLDLDMACAGWGPTVDNYLGRVPKPKIIEAVREAKGEEAAALIAHLKKGDMAREAERLLEGAGWLPEPLRGAPQGLPGEGRGATTNMEEEQTDVRTELSIAAE